MNFNNTLKKIILFSILTLVLIPISTKAQESDSVSVNARVVGCILNIRAYPEKRIPKTGNWDTILTIDIYNEGGTFIRSIPTTTNNQGESTINLCNLGLTLDAGYYSYYLRGYSHLRRGYINYTSFNYYETSIDFTSKQLLAGETSVVYDNYINSLDLSTQIRNLYTADYKNDLNQDSKVNSLDISNTIYNLYKFGE